MVYFGIEPRVAGLKAQTDPLSYGGSTPLNTSLKVFSSSDANCIKTKIIKGRTSISYVF